MSNCGAVGKAVVTLRHAGRLSDRDFDLFLPVIEQHLFFASHLIFISGSSLRSSVKTCRLDMTFSSVSPVLLVLPRTSQLGSSFRQERSLLAPWKRGCCHLLASQLTRFSRTDATFTLW